MDDEVDIITPLNKITWTVISVAAVLVVSATIWLMDVDIFQDVKGEMAAMVQETSAIEPTHVIAMQAREDGFDVCTERLNVLSEFLTQGRQFTAQTFHNGEQASEHMLSVAVASRAEQRGSEFSAMAFGPSSGANCDASYHSVQTLPGSCADLRVSHFPAFVDPVSNDRLAQIWRTEDASSTLYLIAGPNQTCTTIKLQVFY